jgi:hypothetical protein
MTRKQISIAIRDLCAPSLHVDQIANDFLVVSSEAAGSLCVQYDEAVVHFTYLDVSAPRLPYSVPMADINRNALRQALAPLGNAVSAEVPKS